MLSFPGKKKDRPRCCAGGGRPTSANAGWLPPNCRRRTQWYPPGSPAGPSSGPFTWPRWTAWGQSFWGCSPSACEAPTRAMRPGPLLARRAMPDQYRVSPLRRQLAMDCAQASLAVKRDLKPQEISLYVGIPFVSPGVLHCSFILHIAVAKSADPRSLDALLAKADAAWRRGLAGGKPSGRSIWAGGPPLTLEGSQLAELLDRLRRAFQLAPARVAVRCLLYRTPSPGKSSSPSGRAAATGSPSTPRPCPTLSWQPSAAATGPRISAGPMPWPGRPVWEHHGPDVACR